MQTLLVYNISLSERLTCGRASGVSS